MIKKTILASILLGLFGVTANAQILVDDNFDRADGSLAGTSPTPGPGSAWATFSGTAGQLQISSGQAVVSTAQSEDVNISFAGQSSGVLMANFDITVSAAAAIAGGDYEYFALFSDGGTSLFRSRLDIVAPNVTGTGNDYSLGISTSTSTAETIFPTDFTFGNTINVTLSFDFGTGLSSVTVGATTISSTTSVLGDTLSAFALRESTSSSSETILVDNLVVTAVPEPSTIAIAGIGGVAALFALRRRK